MVPKRVSDRMVRFIGKYQEVLAAAKARDVNESDTVTIVKDILADVFGYDKFLEVTSEYEVKGTFCDIALKVDNKVEYLIEVKAIGLDLKEGHLRQAIDYGANIGVQWIILTNGIDWRVYRIKFEKPINYDSICSFTFVELDPKNEESQEKLFIVCKEGLGKDAREGFHEKVIILNRFVLGAFIVSEEVVAVIRRELRKISDGVLVTPEEITKVLTKEVLKREILEGDEADKAQSRVRQFFRKAAKRTKDKAPEKPSAGAQVETSLDSAPSDPVQDDSEAASAG